MNDVQVIPTEYHGTLFRSRLEARWAVLFDVLHMPWEYEPEAFGNRVTGYTPDFWLPEQGVFIEVKPTEVYDHDKVALACQATGKNVVIVIGRPGLPRYMTEGCSDCVGESFTGPFIQGPEEWGWDNFYLLTECNQCGQFDFTHSGWGRQFRCKCYPPDHKSGDAHSVRLHNAFQAARGYRFWNPA